MIRPRNGLLFREFSTSHLKTNVLRVRTSELKRRRAARILVINPSGQTLLFEYSHGQSNDALTGKGSYYTVPGGRARDNETFAECARRELNEETGIRDKIPERVIALRQAPLMLPSGQIVLADEQYFAVNVNRDQALDTSRWTVKEKQNIKQAMWCSPTDLAKLVGRNLWPSTLCEILAAAQSMDSPQQQQQQQQPPPPPLEYKSSREQIGNVIVEVAYDD